MMFSMMGTVKEYDRVKTNEVHKCIIVYMFSILESAKNTEHIPPVPRMYHIILHHIIIISCNHYDEALSGLCWQ